MISELFNTKDRKKMQLSNNLHFYFTGNKDSKLECEISTQYSRAMPSFTTKKALYLILLLESHPIVCSWMGWMGGYSKALSLGALMKNVFQPSEIYRLGPQEENSLKARFVP